MSLITRCPACQTTFRVVPDQLRISQGWVRCGQCQQIFDANAALIDELVTGVSAPAAPDLSMAFGAVDVGAIDVSAIDVGAIDVGAIDVAAIVAASTPTTVDVAAVAPPGAAPQAEHASEPILNPQVSPTVLPHEQLVDTARQDVSFMRRMPERSSWQRTSLRVLLTALALFLIVGLGLQVVVYDRERIAALFPQAKPTLLWICQYARCSFSGLRQIESVVIDSSSLNKVRGDAYRLSLVLRNTSALDVAMPALELTLTDSRDQPVMRRVLLPNEFAAGGVLGGAADWSGAVSLAVRGNGSAVRFSGYRVLAFYP